MLLQLQKKDAKLLIACLLESFGRHCQHIIRTIIPAFKTLIQFPASQYIEAECTKQKLQLNEVAKYYCCKLPIKLIIADRLHCREKDIP